MNANASRTAMHLVARSPGPMWKSHWLIVCLAAVTLFAGVGFAEAQRGAEGGRGETGPGGRGDVPGPGRGGAPPTARAAAAFDLTGTWVAVITEDWRWRMVTPPKNDVASVPLNGEGRKVAAEGLLRPDPETQVDIGRPKWPRN